MVGRENVGVSTHERIIVISTNYGCGRDSTPIQ